MEPRETTKFRFSGGGYKCPYCSSGTGWSYLRNHGKEFGQCFSCGKKNFPGKNLNIPTQSYALKEKPLLPDKYISEEIVQKSLKCYDLNPFVLFLESQFGKDGTQKVLSQFRIGTAKNGGTVFWYVDKARNVRKPKVVYYNLDGKRIKGKKPNFGGYTNDKGYRLCLFGEHQLQKNYFPVDTPVFMVESEKTACIGYLAMPQYIWVAIGGDKVNLERANALKGRQVIILPDADEPGRKGSESTSQILTKLSISNKILDLFPERNDKTDLADYIISLHHTNKTEVISRQIPVVNTLPENKKVMLEVLFHNNPILWSLTEKLGLVVKDVKLT
ncbi:DUF6371 domain-containing protein [Adhaeribacter rhizoryzae]|uniref:DUF6371 domain-containing protein n=1 Tax=Adhaeribacter rhizoryzae TaxID=2607907 RepID=A0A5M6D4J2_9BACT|nr:DUF6371 domain-containing protein [Adhaeribacter rhizoryzae]KAA5542424.1 hypothetical protein F0145_18410 [Adhaeribacter rhizoryzae]